nr:abortive infection family protein [Azospirillum sp. OGB3]
MVVDVAKTLIEICCKTILEEREVTLRTSTPKLPDLLRETVRCLEFDPDRHPEGTTLRDGLKNIVNGLTTTIQGIAAVRNIPGIGHGAPTGMPDIRVDQAAFIVGSADAVVSFLFHMHQSVSKPEPVKTPDPPMMLFQDNEPFNEHVDVLHDVVKIFDKPYRPAEVLFHVDREAYVAALEDFQEDDKTGAEPATATEEAQ